MNATLDQLLTHVETRFNQIQSLNATVQIVASEGGSRQGQVIQHPSFSGYIFLRKPQAACASCSVSPFWAPRRSTWSATARPGNYGFRPDM